ncbi:MAG: hypothetical protein IPH05_11900 [Flavobacteriales bacterium]|nr:hypothetical protein [Flavobacteriales bacterium]
MTNYPVEIIRSFWTLGDLQYMNSTGLNIPINVLTRTRNAGGDLDRGRLTQRPSTLRGHQTGYGLTIAGTVDEAASQAQRLIHGR